MAISFDGQQNGVAISISGQSDDELIHSQEQYTGTKHPKEWFNAKYC